jgi:hypothetical protein
MAGRVYFGNNKVQKWIKAPNSSMEASGFGYMAKMNFINGGASVRRSNRTHREFSFSWLGQINTADASQDLRPVKDFHDGIYGNGPFYWVDPFAMTGNMMSPEWAAPMLAEQDWTPLTDSITPTFTELAYANGYPVKYATYALPAGHAGTNKFTIIIPQSYKVSFGWHSTVAGETADTDGGVRIIRYARSGGTASYVYPESILAGGLTRSNVTVDGDTYSRIEVQLYNGAASSKSVNLVGMIAMMTPSSISAPGGDFVSGMGTNSLEFEGAPTMNYISSALEGGMIEMSAKLTEVV